MWQPLFNDIVALQDNLEIRPVAHEETRRIITRVRTV